MYNVEIETLKIDALRKLQTERLKQQVEMVYNTVPYYRKKFEQAGITPNQIKSIKDIYRLPFTYKSALREEYPFGLFTRNRKEMSRLHCSSGTTGKPIVVGYTKNDIELFSEVVARSLVAAGCQQGMLMQNAYGYGLFTGGLGIHYGAEKLGMTVLPISGGNTEKQMMLMEDFQSEVICCTPSYALAFAEQLRNKGYNKENIPFKVAVLGAEPWTESVRLEVENKLGVQATNIYGLSEIIGPGVSQEDKDEKGTGSYIWEDHFYPEIVDKNTGMPLPHGEKGVLVLTTLTKEGMPMLRYWTNDITSISYEHSYKRTHIKMAPISGRADDMLIIRGVNLFHTQVEECIKEFESLSNNYQLVVNKKGVMDNVEVNVEVEKEVFDKISAEYSIWNECDFIKNMQAQLGHRIKTYIGLSMNINIVEPTKIPRSEGGKLNRIVDLRE